MLPGVSIKPDLSPRERTEESLLLKERRALILSGTDRKAIKIRGSALFVNKIKYGVVINSVFQRCHSSSDSTLSTSSQNTVAASTKETVAIQSIGNNASSASDTDSNTDCWLQVGLWNARSLNNKFSYFQSLVLSKSFDIFCVTETWLTRSVYNNEILPANFTIYRRDRCTRGGGVLIAVSNAISSRLVHSSDTIELIAVELGLVPKVLLCCLYIPPASSDQYLLHVLDSIDSLCNKLYLILFALIMM